jgi:hypothetical protein
MRSRRYKKLRSKLARHWIIISTLFRERYLPIPRVGTEFAEKLKYYTEKNIAAAQGFVHGLTQATDLNDVFRIQTEFMRMQLNAFGEQAKSLGDAFTKLATGAIQTPFKKV